MNSIELKVTGMTCGHCVKHVSEALQAVSGVTGVEVDLAAGLARVAGQADSPALIAALDEAGYPAAINTAASTPAAQTGCGGNGGCGCR
ncbi:CopZ family metallochaperone [Stutzerimonas stutzeri]|uniref:CopZ family metallochaperone n=1 Tax=Stutzerimonas stutzeri TaxID=316 RepID=UPI001BCEB976|nr:heavy-metal-associated domain-containing protein [Stutzerimonas stutzeri]